MEDLEKELSRHTLDIAAEMTQRLLGDLLSADKQHELVKKQLIKLEKTYGKRS
jgi:hypothetical protein